MLPATVAQQHSESDDNSYDDCENELDLGVVIFWRVLKSSFVGDVYTGSVAAVCNMRDVPRQSWSVWGSGVGTVAVILVGELESKTGLARTWLLEVDCNGNEDEDQEVELHVGLCRNGLLVLNCCLRRSC